MVSIRLRRMGTKKKPFYRLVVSDRRERPTGRVVESVGYYDPRREPEILEVDLARADYWIERGARPSDAVNSLLRRARERAA